VYTCTGTKWSNTCEVLQVGIDGVCHQLPEPYFESIGSAGPDRGAICRVFDGTALPSPCKGTGISMLAYLGDDNLYDSDEDGDAGHQTCWISCHQCNNCI
ncbi:hypothetical protein B0T18DRAFT_324535, partial [Schizothecium vesticola]